MIIKNYMGNSFYLSFRSKHLHSYTEDFNYGLRVLHLVRTVYYL